MVQPQNPVPRPEQLTVRFPQGMLDVLREYARRNDRSLNAEIVHALRHWTQEKSVNAPHQSRNC